MSPPELLVVVPVYNEERLVESVLDEWLQVLDALSIEYQLAVYDDGSSDRTFEILEGIGEKNDRIEVVRHENRGHGPTILRGYREARAPWVLQIDSDGELPASEFEKLWQQRDTHDFLIGRRANRISAPIRRAISASSVWVTRLLYGTAVVDVNSPYRLMRNAWLQQAIGFLPSAPFAPNVLLSGIASHGHARIYEIPIPYRGRTAGEGTLRPWSLAKGVARSFGDCLVTALALRRGRSS